jgi:hypothetical protein
MSGSNNSWTGGIYVPTASAPVSGGSGLALTGFIEALTVQIPGSSATWKGTGPPGSTSDADFSLTDSVGLLGAGRSRARCEDYRCRSREISRAAVRARPLGDWRQACEVPARAGGGAAVHGLPVLE